MVIPNLDLVADAIAEHLGARPESIEPLVTLNDRLVCEVVISGYSVVFKSVSHDPLEVEAWGFDRARGAGVPVPRVLALDTSKSAFPADFMITERIQGVPLSNLSATDESFAPITKNAARHLRGLHEVQMAGLGLLNVDVLRKTGAVKGNSDSWPAVIVQRTQYDLRTLEEQKLVNPEALTKLRRAVESLSDELALTREGRLIHGDFGSEHILIDGDKGEIAGFIDFADVMSGDPALDLACFDLWWHPDGEERRQILLEGYDLDSDLRERYQARVHLYEAIGIAANMRFRHERGVDFGNYPARLDEALGELGL